ncbi:MAG: ribonuclease D, partial [Pseudomonadota bacterium]|nr:ribonuclease D [Pseudomonadota bacterium]
MLTDNGQRIAYIETQAELEEVCRDWLTLPVVALDTEFMRTNTFYPRLGLLQVADGSQCYLIDPLKISDWGCFISVLSNPGCEIVLH